MNTKFRDLSVMRLQSILCIAILTSILAGCPFLQRRSTLYVSNNSSRALDEVYVSGCDDPYWGSNDLDSAILPGESAAVGTYVYGCYDVLVVNEDGNDIVFWGETFDQAEENLIVQEGERSTLYVTNNSAQALTEIYVSIWYAEFWGNNQIDLPVLPGETVEVGEYLCDWYDLLAVNESGESTREYAVFDEPEVVWTISGSGGQYTDFYVMNDSSRTITELYVSPCIAESWGANQISIAVSPGQRIFVGAYGHGCYDLLAVADTGEYIVVWGEEFDQLEQEWTLSDTKIRTATGDKSRLNAIAKVRD